MEEQREEEEEWKRGSLSTDNLVQVAVTGFERKLRMSKFLVQLPTGAQVMT